MEDETKIKDNYKKGYNNPCENCARNRENKKGKFENFYEICWDDCIYYHLKRIKDLEDRLNNVQI